MKRIALAVAAFALVAAAASAGSAVAAPAVPVQHVKLVVKSDTQHAKMGSDGKWHDAFLPAGFAVTSGAEVVVTIENHDQAPHTFTAPRLHLNVVIRAAKGSTPSVTTFSFTAPRSGSFTWHCMGPCDPWAMTHTGFMTGRVTVLPAT